MENETCKDLGHNNKSKPPPNFKKIRVYLHCDFKCDGYHEVRLAANSNMTEVPFYSVYSRLVSLKGIRLFLFLAEINGLES